MTVEQLSYDGCCDECDEFTTVYEIKSDNGIRYLKLCKECLFDLLKAIVGADKL